MSQASSPLSDSHKTRPGFPSKYKTSCMKESGFELNADCDHVPCVTEYRGMHSASGVRRVVEVVSRVTDSAYVEHS
jgi:hypothetical protein